MPASTPWTSASTPWTSVRSIDLADEVSELRILVTGIGERVSRNEGQIQIIREQLQTVDAPAP